MEPSCYTGWSKNTNHNFSQFFFVSEYSISVTWVCHSSERRNSFRLIPICNSSMSVVLDLLIKSPQHEAWKSLDFVLQPFEMSRFLDKYCVVRERLEMGFCWWSSQKCIWTTFRHFLRLNICIKIANCSCNSFKRYMHKPKIQESGSSPKRVF